MTCVCSLVIGAPRGKCQELLAGAGVVADQAAQRRGNGLGAELLNTAQRHAQVLGLQHDPDALGLKFALKPAGDLRGQPFLDLQVAAEELDDAAELAETDDPLAREIADTGGRLLTPNGEDGVLAAPTGAVTPLFRSSKRRGGPAVSAGGRAVACLSARRRGDVRRAAARPRPAPARPASRSRGRPPALPASSATAARWPAEPRHAGRPPAARANARARRRRPAHKGGSGSRVEPCANRRDRQGLRKWVSACIPPGSDGTARARERARGG